MRSMPFGRAHLLAVAAVVTALVGALVTSSTPAGSVAAVAEPQFLTWEGEPYTDGYDHYLVELNAAVGHTNWLEIDNDRLVATDSAPNEVAPSEIADAVTGATTKLTPTEIAAAIERHPGVATVRPLPFGIIAVAGTITSQELADLPGVANVAVDPGLQAATVDPYYPSQWGLDNDGVSTDPWLTVADADIDAPEGWHRTRGRGVVVAVVDSGTDIHHPDLAANIWRNSDEQCGNGVDDDANGYVDDCHGWDFANGWADLTDLVGHGTHVSGIIAATANNGIGVAGVAHEAEIMALKIGDGTPTLSAAIEAIAYAIDNGANVINASWVVDDPAAAAFLDTAIDAAGDAGILVVAAAGNEPNDVDSEPVFPAASPLGNIITVGASTALDEPAGWSAYGASSVDLFAPGEHIISTVPGGYGVYSGTSMAAPMVSGAAALLWAATPEASYAEVKGALLDRSDGPNDGVTAFRGLATSDGRLNVNRSIYSAPLFQPSLMFDFYEFNSFEPAIAHKVAVTAKTVDPWIVPPQTPAMYRAGLYVPVDGQPMAVVGQEITYTGEEGDLTSVTDSTGRALIGLEFEPQQRPALVQDGDVTPLSMELPAGTYAFVMEVVDVTDVEDPQRMGDPSAVFFIVSDDGSVAEMPQIPIAADPAPTPPTTSGPGVTTQPPGTVTTTTADQSNETTTTTAPSATSSTTTSAPAPTTAAPPTTIVAVTSTTEPLATTTTTTTTTVPATTAPPVSTTTTVPAITTTIPTGTTTSTTTTTTTNPPELAILDVDPDTGPTGGASLVTVTGREIPENVQVLFGDEGARIVAVIPPTFIVVDAPPGEPGWVDVTVIATASGDRAVLPNGFLYADDGEDPPPPPPTSLPITTTTEVPASTAPPISTTAAPSPTTTHLLPTTSQAPTSTTQPSSPSDLFDDWRDSLLRTPEGLQLAPPANDDPIRSLALDVWIGTLCNQPVCPGWVIEE